MVVSDYDDDMIMPTMSLENVPAKKNHTSHHGLFKDQPAERKTDAVVETVGQKYLSIHCDSYLAVSV